MNMVTSIKTKLIILITCTFWIQLVLANRTICPDKKVQIPKEIKALKLLTANFVVTNNSIEIMNKYNNIFVSNSKKKVLDYSLTKHIYLLIDINTNIQLSNSELSKIQDFILKLNRNELDERLINNLNVLKTLVEFRLAEKDELLDADVIQSFKDIKFETLLKYFSVYTQKGMIRELGIKINKPETKFIEIALNYSKKKSKFLNLLKAKNFNKRRITREIKDAITNDLLSMSYRDDPDRRLNRRLSYMIIQFG